MHFVSVTVLSEIKLPWKIVVSFFYFYTIFLTALLVTPLTVYNIKKRKRAGGTGRMSHARHRSWIKT